MLSKHNLLNKNKLLFCVPHNKKNIVKKIGPNVGFPKIFTNEEKLFMLKMIINKPYTNNNRYKNFIFF